MGSVYSISHSNFPKQGSFLGKRVAVCFHYCTDHFVKGECVRDDVEDPGRMIFKLDDGRYVLATECQYRED